MSMYEQPRFTGALLSPADERAHLRRRLVAAFAQAPVTRDVNWDGGEWSDDFVIPDQPEVERMADVALDILGSDVESLHEVQCPGCGATIRARMADAGEGTEQIAVQALREAIEYQADGFPLVSSHITDRLDIVRAAVAELEPPKTGGEG